MHLQNILYMQGHKRGDKMEKRMGRPPKQTQSRNKSLNIRLTDAELNMINGCAQRLGISRTDAIIKGIELIEQKK